MESELAKRLFSDGGTLVLLDVPEGTEVGIDYKSWNSGPKFKGIKMISSGFHFIYYRSVAVKAEKYFLPFGIIHVIKVSSEKEQNDPIR